MLPKPYAKAIESVRRQWSGSEKRVMKVIEAISRVYYAPLKCNRLVNDTLGVDPYKRVDTFFFEKKCLDTKNYLTKRKKSDIINIVKLNDYVN